MMWRRLRDSRERADFRRRLNLLRQVAARANARANRAESHVRFLEGFISAMIDQVRRITGVRLRPPSIKLRDSGNEPGGLP